MSKRWMTVLLVLVFLLGLSILLYPTIADYVNSFSQTRAIQTYNQQAHEENEARNQAMLDAAMAFNEMMSKRGSLIILTEEETATYHSLLNPNGDGIMGYIEIPKIDVSLTIGHTTEEEVLQRMVGHLPGSSLPVEGESVHAVVSAHRGLPSAKLFSDLDLMEVGDMFTVHVLNRTYNYKVDQITVILPEETEALQISPNHNYMTLMTCTPYGVNTHRLLVRAEMMEPDVQEAALIQGAETLAPFYVIYRNELIIATAAFLGVLFVILLLRRRGRK